MEQRERLELSKNGFADHRLDLFGIQCLINSSDLSTVRCDLRLVAGYNPTVRWKLN